MTDAPSVALAQLLFSVLFPGLASWAAIFCRFALIWLALRFDYVQKLF
jgi:hypothetical protein